MVRSLLIAIFVVLLTSSLVAAQNQHPNQARGFNANGVYSTFDIDHINTFNGNLVVTIPLGQTYPVNGKLSYSLNLVYNSNVWSPREVCPNTVSQSQLSSTFLSLWTRRLFGTTITLITETTPVPTDSDPYQPAGPRTQSDQCWTIQDPNPTANAGLGWQVSMGKIYKPRDNEYDPRPDYTEKSLWVYMSADGSEHSFYPRLHVDDPAGSSNILYTRDGSYLRLNLSSPDISKGDMLIEFPDGRVQYFTSIKVKDAINGDPAVFEERLTRIEDRFGNNVTVQYLDTDGNGLKDDQWIITDSLGRQQTLTFTSPAAGYPKALNHIALDAFGGQTAHYGFDYEPQTIIRPIPHVPAGMISGYDDNIRVDFLTAIHLPDGSQYSMPFPNSYLLPSSVDPNTSYLATNPGVLQKVVLPTGGSIQWKFQAENPTQDRSDGYGYRFGLASSARHYLRSALGVRRRVLTEGSNTYVWSYDPKLGSVQPEGCNPLTRNNTTCAPAEFVNTVTTPEGDHTRYYFSVWPFPFDQNDPSLLNRGLSDPHSADYGLPFTKDPRPDNVDPLLQKSYSDVNGKPLFLSEAIYDSQWHLINSTYVRFESDTIALGNGFGSTTDANNRVVASRTVYNDDGGRYAEVQNSDFDGLGHYRRGTTWGNFGSGDNRTEVTTYNAGGTGTYYIDPTNNQPGAGHTYQAYNETLPWILDTYDSKIASDYSQRSTTYFKFDSKGALIAKRARKDFETASTAYLLGPSDVLVQYNYDETGNVVGESYFGGDRSGRAPLNTSNRFPALTDSSSEYKINYGHQCVRAGGTFGMISVVNNTTYRGVTFKTTDDTIDCDTGLVKSSRESAGIQTNGNQSNGVQTNYDYDVMGRLKYITRQEGNQDKIDYDAAVGSSLPKVTVTQLDRTNPNPSTGRLGQEIYIYDQLGRLIIEKRLMPDGAFQVRNTTYNGMGWKTLSSEWNDGTTNAGRKTVYSNFDPFGRARKITLPDNKVVTLGYAGVRQVTRTTSIATQIDAGGVFTEQDSTTKEIYDRQGRLAQVIEPSTVDPTTGAWLNVTWSYSYNVNHQLVGSTATDPISNVSQNRSFSYDNLGNLLAQTIPERPWSQSFEYDTKGNVGKTFDGLHWLSYGYDSAGRPTVVNELSGAALTPRPIKEFTYYAANGGTGGTFSMGKLATTTRHNYVLNPYEITQNYALASNGGTVVASSTNSAGFDPQYVIDGKRSGAQWGVNGGWNDGTANAWPDWVEVRFNGSKSIGLVNVFSLQDNYTNPVEPTQQQTFSLYGLADFQVQYWNGSTWVTVPNGSVAGNNLVWKQISFSPITTDRIRVYITKGLNTWSRITEIEAYGGSPTIYDIGVNEQYTYSGVDGRVSYRTTTTNIPGGPSFDQAFTYDQLGNLSWQRYPKCTNSNCVQTLGAQRPWTASYGYTNGMLTSVGGGAGEGTMTPGTYAPSISYNINGTVGAVKHANGIIDREQMDQNYMQRTKQICTYLPVQGQPECYNAKWITGDYSYDGAGNVKKIGNDWYLYDAVARLKEGTALLGDPLKRLKQQYDYDSFGNRLQTRTYNNVSLTGATLKDTYDSKVDPATNRLVVTNGPQLNYDGAGNLLGMPNAAPVYSYDSMNEIVTAPGLTYLYGPGDERFWIIDTKQNSVNEDNEETFTLRGLANEVLREYKVIGGNAVGHWSWQKDYVYRGRKLLAAETINGIRHYHIDHLGSPRLITDANGTAYERMQFLPFGENSGFYQNGESWSLMYSGEAVTTRLRFTGHEKDSDVIGLDYMHARHYWERSGKFMSVDPVRSWEPDKPQSWNRYTYAANNPLKLIDPNGREPILVSSSDTNMIALLIRTAMRPDGRAALRQLAESSVPVDMKTGDWPNDPGSVSFGHTGGDVSTTRGALNISTVIDTNDILTPPTTLPNGDVVRHGHPKDPTGLWTIGHELRHALSILLHGKEIASHQTDLDKLDHDSGAAEEAAKNLIYQHPDMRWEAAKEWLTKHKIWNVQTGSSPP